MGTVVYAGIVAVSGQRETVRFTRSNYPQLISGAVIHINPEQKGSSKKLSTSALMIPEDEVLQFSLVPILSWGLMYQC